MRGRDLSKPFRGVYVARTQDLSYIDRCAALLQKLPPDVFLCSFSAARVLGVPLPIRLESSMLVHVGVHAPGSPPVGRGIRGHELGLDEWQIIERAGLAITAPGETWCSLGAHLSLAELVGAGDFLIRRDAPLTTREALRECVAAWKGKRGVKNLRDAIELLNDRSESVKESELRVLLVRAGFAGLEANFPIRTSGGYDYRGDLAFPQRKLIIEYQSVFHETPERFRADMTRISRLDADEWKVMQVNKDDMRTPTELLARIERTLASRPYY
jgi:very-short-patch-repair endonuclease